MLLPNVRAETVRGSVSVDGDGKGSVVRTINGLGQSGEGEERNGGDASEHVVGSYQNLCEDDGVEGVFEGETVVVDGAPGR